MADNHVLHAARVSMPAMNSDKTTNPTGPVDAVMVSGPGCPHCASVRQVLATLISEGIIGKMQLINIEVEAEEATGLGVTTVPWVRLGNIELLGAHSEAEIRHWAARAASVDGLREHFESLLNEGNRVQVSARIQRYPDELSVLIGVLGDPQAPMNSRLGVAAILEDLEGSDLLAASVDELANLCSHADPRIRIDACHYLSYIHSSRAREYLLLHRADDDHGVREEVEDALIRFASLGIH